MKVQILERVLKGNEVQMAARFLVSPTDPKDLVEAVDGIVSSIPENFGADLLTWLPRGSLALQRKTYPEDLLASAEDNRLTASLPLLAGTSFPVFVLEGALLNDRFGQVIRNGRPCRWSVKQVHNLLRSIHYQFGVSLEFTANIKETAEVAKELAEWLSGEHWSLLSRHKERDDWGSPLQNSPLHEFILQGFPGVGPKTAQAILAKFKTIPLKWSCSKEEMLKVPGVGKRTTRELFKVLEEKG